MYKNRDRYKFRAWLKNKKRYEYDIENCYEDWEYDCFGDYLKDEDSIVEQCTGLKDVNGELIYEGDIFTAEVINSFKDDPCLNKIIGGQVAYYANEASFTFTRYAPINLHNIEIVGNIHENADILEKWRVNNND